MVTLPITPLKKPFLDALKKAPVVLSAPTGSGKSTQLPQWCAQSGPVLIIEPRRVACRSLASHVAQLRGAELGKEVGYRVRDENRSSPGTQLLFVTTGVALNLIQKGQLKRFTTVIIDEFHERSLDVDLILALLLQLYQKEQIAENRQNLVIMSATLSGDALAAHVGGLHLEGEGKAYPVKTHYVGAHGELPNSQNIESYLTKAVQSALQSPGDILVFLPGKGEINRAMHHLKTVPGLLEKNTQLLPLHGGLNLETQNQVFRSHNGRKIILATNVAETSLTVPGISAVIDSGLVRQTRYHGGRGHLDLLPIAQDSAIQRTGRAGRLGPGQCYRLWGPSARLDTHTSPEIFRESLVPLVLAAAACKESCSTLPFLDPPKEHAVLSATERLESLGALSEAGEITQNGRALFGLPIDAHLGRLLIEAKGKKAAQNVVHLIAAIAVGRPLFSQRRPEHVEDDLRAAGCDATAFILALRGGKSRQHLLNDTALKEARRIAQRLGPLVGLTPGSAPKSQSLKLTAQERQELILLVLKALPKSAMVARHRKREIAFSAGGTEHQLARESAVNADKAEAIIAFDSRAFGSGPRARMLIVTCAMPIRFRDIAKAGLAKATIGKASVKGGTLSAQVDFQYANRVVHSEERPLKAGPESRAALLTLLLEGRLYKKARPIAKQRLEQAKLHQQLLKAELAPNSFEVSPWPEEQVIPSLETWYASLLSDLEVDDYATLCCLDVDDFLPPALPEDLQQQMSRYFPQTVDLGETTYCVQYKVSRRQVLLERVSGKGKEWPRLSYLPKFSGFSISVQHGNVHHSLKKR